MTKSDTAVVATASAAIGKLHVPKLPVRLSAMASEVAQLKLNADWVVLSACNTIAGD